MRFRTFVVLLTAFTLAACAGKPGASQSPTASKNPPAQTAASSSTPQPPTPTSEPLALKVNGEGVSLAEFQAQLKQLQAAEPQTAAADARKRVLQELVDETLLAQAALKAGFSLSDDALQARIDALVKQAGGDAAFADWQNRMGYTPASFRSALRRSLAAAWQRDQITAGVPASAEQIHARQILVHDQATADQVEAQAKQAGTNFATLAFGYDQATGGDLSWFPRGYLNEKAVEDAAFALQPGEISPVVQSSLGFHVIQVVARETRPLSQNALLVLQKKALAAWLDDARKSSQVQELAP